MVGDPPPHANGTAARGGCAAGLTLGLLLACWLIGTPVCLYVAAISGATLFGEPASDTDLRTSTWAFVAAVGCGLAAPAVAATIAAVTRRKTVATVCAALLILTGTAGVGTGVLSPDTARAVRDQVWPRDPEPVTERAPVCQERSGGDTDCPGG